MLAPLIGFLSPALSIGLHVVEHTFEVGEPGFGQFAGRAFLDQRELNTWLP